MYARDLDGRTLTLALSGMLWNRSLVMIDSPTGSLWSHLLGEALQGVLKGRQLEALPSDMITWQAWRQAYPKTTVLALSRTHRAYTKQFYRDPADFVLGWVTDGRAYHCSLDVLSEKRLVPCTCGGSPLLAAFDPASTAARLFSRRLGQQVLDFAPERDGRMRDAQTGTIWDSHTGKALTGPLAGNRLEHRVGIVSYARAWKTFHPQSRQQR